MIQLTGLNLLQTPLPSKWKKEFINQLCQTSYCNQIKHVVRVCYYHNLQLCHRLSWAGSLHRRSLVLCQTLMVIKFWYTQYISIFAVWLVFSNFQLRNISRVSTFWYWIKLFFQNFGNAHSRNMWLIIFHIWVRMYR